MLENLIIIFDAVLYNSTGLLFIVLGAFILIRMVGFPDLTIDGSFTIGAVFFSTIFASGGNILLALLGAFIGGTLGGLMTWVINDRLGVGKVVSGVLSMIILILSAPYFSGGSTVSLINVSFLNNVLSDHDLLLSGLLVGSSSYKLHFAETSFWLGLVALTSFFVFSFLKSRIGIQLRYMGDCKNPTLLTPQKRRLLLAIGLALGNGLVAIGGAIEAQRRGGFTVNMGTGTILIALAALVLGESFLKSFLKREYLHLAEYILAILFGVVFYNLGIQLLLLLDIQFIDLRLLTAFFLVLLLAIGGRYYSSSAKLF